MNPTVGVKNNRHIFGGVPILDCKTLNICQYAFPFVSGQTAQCITSKRILMNVKGETYAMRKDAASLVY